MAGGDEFPRLLHRRHCKCLGSSKAIPGANGGKWPTSEGISGGLQLDRMEGGTLFSRKVGVGAWKFCGNGGAGAGQKM